MQINIVDKYSFEYKDLMQASNYEIEVNSEYSGKSTIIVARKPKAIEGDFVLLFDGGKSYSGVIDSLENEEGKTQYKINLLEIPKIFDNKLVLTNESLLKTGIEDFIANQITSNFVSSNDTRLNKTYITVTCKTHTPIEALVDADDGIYNLCTYMGNALTTYGIYIDFVFSKAGIEIVLEKKSQSDLKIDLKISDVSNLVETYQIETLAKLTVLWKTSDDATAVQKQYFLKTDRTITSNIDDDNRADGSSDVIAITAETEAEMYEEVVNQFKGNSYNHKIEFDIIDNSVLIPVSVLSVGSECVVKTSAGIKDSIVTLISYESGSSVCHVELGQLKVTLLEKLKGR